jgi:SSS family transporter
MSFIDWLVLAAALLSIIVYGIYKSRHTKDIDSYLRASRKMPWYSVGLSVIATQASAITFLAAPGQGYRDGLRFVQFYFGLPLAMIVLCITFIPNFHKLNVYTAYEYLEKRFDIKTRAFTAILFLIQRGLSTGITIYAPAIILSILLNINVTYTTVVTGLAVILYTVYGGTKAVSYTQMFQMAIIFSGLIMAGYMVVHLLPPGVGFTDALHIAGKMDHTNALVTKFDPRDRYNIWSGIIGGFFLQLSYFGTDQSQVGRYLTGSSITQSRLGLVMNGLVKIPMQFLILLLGVLVFTFYQFHTPPIFFNKLEAANARTGAYSAQYIKLENDYQRVHNEKQQWVNALVPAVHQNNQQEIAVIRTHLQQANTEADSIRKSAIPLIQKSNALAEAPDDTNYIFLSFVTTYLPVGMVGLLIAIILLAAMGSTASGLNSLTSTTIIDFYRRYINCNADERTYLRASRLATVGWGLFCIVVGLYASRLGNLIEAVNILGSLFYGTILGIFLVAFYLKKVGGTSVFYAAILTEILVVIVWKWDIMAFLWLNVVGCLLVIIFSLILHAILPEKEEAIPDKDRL